MIFNMVGGGGAGGASIFIVNSVNQRPTNVFNNTLWVNTDVDVVKYVFSDNEPSNPTEGMLWLAISNSDNVNVAAPINKDWMKFNLGIVRQYIDGVWERKLAQLYKDGIWVDVSKIFVAYIDITYPANSTCTVTNSIGQVVASNANSTSSEKTFTAIVGATGTYTVTATATDGTNSKSESVSITSEGQRESVELMYRLVLFDNGIVVPFSEGLNTSATVSIGSVIKVASGADFKIAAAVTDDKYDLTDYNTLYFEVTQIEVDGKYDDAWLYVDDTRTAPAYNYGNLPTGLVAVANPTSIGRVPLDVSTLTDSYYIGVGVAPNSSVTVSKIWLE